MLNLMRNNKGQSTLEFAIVATVLILIVIALAALLHKFSDGTILMHAIVSATHNISSSVTGVIDAFSF